MSLTDDYRPVAVQANDEITEPVADIILETLGSRSALETYESQMPGIVEVGEERFPDKFAVKCPRALPSQFPN